MSIATPLTRLLDIEHPVMLAPMGGVAGGALAGAVSNAGGFGFIGSGYADPAIGYGDDWLEAQFAAAGNARVGVGFITWSLARRPRALDAALAHGPRAVFLSFGDASRFAAPVRAAGAKLVMQVQTVAAARAAAELGADIIVAQGGEAGGHGHVRSTLPLVPAVVDAVAPLPVVAAGGIADGRGLAAALMLGATGALIGTGFYAAREALAHPAAKARLVESSGDNTRRGHSVDSVRGLTWPADWTIRTLENDFTSRWSDDDAGLQAALPEEAERYGAAVARGDFDTAIVIAGEAADLVRAEAPAADILARITGEAEALLAAAPGMLDRTRGQAAR